MKFSKVILMQMGLTLLLATISLTSSTAVTQSRTSVAPNMATGNSALGGNANGIPTTLFSSGSPIRAADVNSLRASINSMRQSCSLSPIVWSSQIVAGVTPIQLQQLQEMRAALIDPAITIARPIVTDPVLSPGIPIKAAHFSELQTALSTSSCAGAPVVINCVGSWGACASGNQTYNITTAAANGGAACPFTNGATQACAGGVWAASSLRRSFRGPTSGVTAQCRGWASSQGATTRCTSSMTIGATCSPVGQGCYWCSPAMQHGGSAHHSYSASGSIRTCQ